jgi:hypothetical protein
MGINPLLCSYGGSDFSEAPLLTFCPQRSPAFTPVLFSRPTITKHPNTHPLHLPCSHTGVAGIAPGRLHLYPAGSARLSKPNRVHLSLRSIWFFPLLPTPPHGDAVTSSSHRHNGCPWPRSLTLKEDTDLQRTGLDRRGGRQSFDQFPDSLAICPYSNPLLFQQWQSVERSLQMIAEQKVFTDQRRRIPTLSFQRFKSA